MALVEFQQYLEKHFTDLAGQRARDGLPVFALEHGLQMEQLASLVSQIRQIGGRGNFDPSLWLVWVVYAAEEGYQYKGEEYWYTFSDHLPRWNHFGDRSTIRTWYKKFSKTFSGAVPSGDWAKHFSIIAWPITHAILPTDLQRQLAQIIFEVRHSLVGAGSRDASQVGLEIARQAEDSHVTSRFYHFVQQTELVGQVVLSLLNPNAPSNSLLETTTLQRLTAALESNDAQRQWMVEARQIYATPKVKFGPRHLPGIHRAPEVVAPEAADEAPSTASVHRLHPHLQLIHGKQSAWSCHVTLPTFRGYPDPNAHYATALRGSRVRVPATGTGWQTKGWLLGGPYEKRIVKWPARGSQWTEFEEPTPTILRLSTHFFEFEEKSVWLFRLSEDGVGREVRSQVVHPGGTYAILVRSQDNLNLDEQAMVLECEGIQASLVKVPARITDDYADRLRIIGLVPVGALHVAPVGSAPRYWDGQGFGEWLTTERPALRIFSDCVVNSFSIQLDAEPAINAKSDSADGGLLVQLGTLNSGEHLLKIRAVYRHELRQRQEELVCEVRLSIRPPTPWRSGANTNGAILANIYPIDATIDDFLGNEIDFSATGPRGDTVVINVSLTSSRDGTPTSFKLMECALPVSSQQWQVEVGRFLEKNADLSAFLGAGSGQISIDAGLMGSYRFPLRQQLKPLRWVYKGPAKGKAHSIRLIDDVGYDGAVVTRQSFADPIRPEIVSAAGAGADLPVTSPGGLYLAKVGEETAAIVVSVPSGKFDLSFLSTGRMTGWSRPEPDSACLVNQLASWASARVAGQFAEIFRRNVCRSLHERLLRQLGCGSLLKVGSRLAAGERSTSVRDAAGEPFRGPRRSFPIALAKHASDWATADFETNHRHFFELARKFGVTNDSQLTMAALIIARKPEKFQDWAASKIAKWLTQLLQLPELMCGAYYLELCWQFPDGLVEPPVSELTR